MYRARADSGQNNGEGGVSLKMDWTHENGENQTKYSGTTPLVITRYQVCTQWLLLSS